MAGKSVSPLVMAVRVRLRGSLLCSVNLFVMSPHSDYFYDLFFFKYLVHQSVLNVNSSGVCTSQIS